MATKCDQNSCNNPTNSPTGFCHHHRGGSARSLASVAKISSIPSSSVAVAAEPTTTCHIDHLLIGDQVQAGGSFYPVKSIRYVGDDEYEVILQGDGEEISRFCSDSSRIAIRYSEDSAAEAMDQFRELMKKNYPGVGRVEVEMDKPNSTSPASMCVVAGYAGRERLFIEPSVMQPGATNRHRPYDALLQTIGEHHHRDPAAQIEGLIRRGKSRKVFEINLSD